MNPRSIILCLGLVVLLQQPVAAQIPHGYYARVEGKTGASLKRALFQVIGKPKVLSYRELWSAFETTDVLTEGKVWDIYSYSSVGGAAYSYDFRRNRCGTIHKEGDCYNREHLFPRSWFRNKGTLETDLFHIYPTDGYVNNRRGNLPFGEVGISRWTSSNGSKVGQNTFGGYTRTVFEPIDEYKGDVARTYFYVVTAYEDQISNWNSAQLSGDSYPAFSEWSLSLLLKWHREDPVSQKEIDRNEAIYRLQKNRNPYIDFPDLAEYVWGNAADQPFQHKAAAGMPDEKVPSPFERWLYKIVDQLMTKYQ